MTTLWNLQIQKLQANYQNLHTEVSSLVEPNCQIDIVQFNILAQEYMTLKIGKDKKNPLGIWFKSIRSQINDTLNKLNNAQSEQEIK